jgi:hypothetical protein
MSWKKYLASLPSRVCAASNYVGTHGLELLGVIIVAGLLLAAIFYLPSMVA